MPFDTAAGATLRVSSSLAADPKGQTEFEALTYTEVGEVTSWGDLPGRVYNLVTHNPLSSRATKKAKGNYNNGTMNPALAWDHTDAGQLILETARDSDDPIAVEAELDNGDKMYFEALVMSYQPNVPDGDGIVTASPTFEINEVDPVYVDAP